MLDSTGTLAACRTVAALRVLEPPSVHNRAKGVLTVNRDQMLELAQALAAAKSRQDLPEAMKLLHEEMVLETPAFGTMARGLAENERVLRRFFSSFPDYHVVLHGHAGSEETLVCWGTAQMTMTGDRFGVVPNGRRAELPVFIQFGFKDDLIARQRFFFDLSALCAQSGVSTDAVRRKLFGDTPDRQPHQQDDRQSAIRARDPLPVQGATNPGMSTPADPRIRPVSEITSAPLLDIAVDLEPPTSAPGRWADACCSARLVQGPKASRRGRPRRRRLGTVPLRRDDDVGCPTDPPHARRRPRAHGLRRSLCHNR
jgi:predicted ester cyclase